jgi:hypothetical protein
MSRAAALALAVLVLAPASAGAGATRPQLALTATPAHLALAGSAAATIRVTNTGRSRVIVDIARAGFSLDVRGRPKVVGPRGARRAADWLTVRPRHVLLPAGATRPLIVASRLPPRVEPGDHDAVVLLTTRPRPGAGVAVRMRIGVVVIVRAPGRIVRRLAVGGLRLRRSRRARFLVVHLRNLGNVTERLERGRVRLTLRGRSGQVRLRAEARDLRPRTSGIAEFPYRGPLSGWVTAHVHVAGEPGRPATPSTYRIKL